MLSGLDSRIVVFLLGICLLQVTTKDTKVNFVAYNGKVGHATSYNYPFKHQYKSVTDTYEYRLFAYNSLADKICLTFHRFGLGNDSKTRFTFYVRTSSTTKVPYHYNGYGESTNHNPNNLLPDNIWKKPFCVNLGGDPYLEFSFSVDANLELPGFYLEYQTTTTDIRINDTAPCGPGLFTCYSRECVNDSYVCTDQAVCTDMSHNTFAHAFCKRYGEPQQQSGFWANNLDTGHAFDIHLDAGWKFTGDGDNGMFLYAYFGSTSASRPTKLTMTFRPGRLIQQENCLSFWYRMNGRDPGTLVVDWGEAKLWQRSGSYGAKWFQAQVNLFCEPGDQCNQQVRFTASRASNPETRISIDDISVMPGLCPFYEADLAPGSWTTDSGCSYITDGSLMCSGTSGYTESWPVSQGQCLVGDVKFDPHTNQMQSIKIYQQPAVVGLPAVHLRSIQHSSNDGRISFKIPVQLSVPAKFGFEMISHNHRLIFLENIHVVDNTCDELSIGACKTDEFYCAAGECILQNRLCDDVKDCRNGKDEEKCEKNQECKVGCNNGRCVDSWRKCNGVNDCLDYSDEKFCASPDTGNSIPSTGTIICIAIGVLVAACALIAIGSIIIEKGCHKHRKPRPPPHLFTPPPPYSECVSHAADNLDYVSSPEPSTNQVTDCDPPPYSHDLPPAYGEACGHM